MRHVLHFALALLLPVCSFAQDAMLPVPPTIKVDGVPSIPMSLVDAISPYGEFRQARLLAWHPTERRMLISTAFGNVTQIHEVRSPGGARTQLTFFRDGVTGGASYDPKGRYFVFRKDTSGGGETMQLFRYDLSSGRITLITDGKSRNGTPSWSRQRGLIAYDSTRGASKERGLYVVDPLDPSTERLVVKVDSSMSALAWSPDDKELLVQELVPGSLETRLWRVAVDSGARTLLSGKSDTPIRWSAGQYSRDGRYVYALSDRESESLRVWKCDLSSGAWTAVTGPGLAVETFALSPAGDVIAVVVQRGSSSELRMIDAASGRQRSVPSLPPGVIASVAWHSSGTPLAIDFAGARTFRDVYALDVRAGRMERWTTSEIGGANPESLPDAELIEWKTFDGRMIPGVLYRPTARFTGPRPVIINVHGGPEQVERPRALGRSNYFRNEMGIAIIYPNIRGSSGFGKTYEHLDDGPKREDAVKDIGALLEWIATRPEFDKQRVMLTGSSYGGYVTLAAAIAYGDRIRCAFEGFGISDFVAFLEGTEPSRLQDRTYEYGDPKDPAVRKFLKSISPLTHAAKLKIPLFIAQGAKDTRVPLNQAEAMAAAVKANGTPVWYVVYLDIGHVETLTRVANDFNTYAWVLFVQRFLLN
jgi:dipeptidyl aminopeptidase/acylaminoacyl peptidase